MVQIGFEFGIGFALGVGLTSFVATVAFFVGYLLIGGRDATY